MIELYARLLARCRTVNQINQVHIALEARMTPPELCELQRVVVRRSPAGSGRQLQPAPWTGAVVSGPLQLLRPEATFPPESHAWIEQLAGWSARSGKLDPEPFVRRRVRANVFSFSGGGATAGKSLLLCFTGLKARLFMPIPVALQFVPAARFDLLVLRDPSRNGFRGGVAGLADDFPGLVEAIGGLFDRSAYRRVVTYGLSAGGLPAIVTALRYGFDKGVSVAGKGPLDPRWQTVCEGGVGRMLSEQMQRRAGTPNLLFVRGADFEADAESSRTLSQVVPLRTLTVHGRNGRTIGHNPLMPLLRRTGFAEFLATALDADVAGFGDAAEGAESRIDV